MIQYWSGISIYSRSIFMRGIQRQSAGYLKFNLQYRKYVSEKVIVAKLCVKSLFFVDDILIPKLNVFIRAKLLDLNTNFSLFLLSFNFYHTCPIFSVHYSGYTGKLIEWTLQMFSWILVVVKKADAGLKFCRNAGL